MSAEKPERIAKVLARAGLCSRREGERWIAAGRVAVNGETLTSPAFDVTPGVRVTVDGRPLDPRLDLRVLSASGFEWGYDGGGPGQLALAILADQFPGASPALTCGS